MKDIIRMNQLAGTITESQAKRMMQILNEAGSSKPITLTPLQKKEFLSAIRDLKRAEDLEYALEEAGNVLANILTNGKAEYIEDVEDFGYDPDEVENYAMDLASSKR
jgi:hypothetical protein